MQSATCRLAFVAAAHTGGVESRLKPHYAGVAVCCPCGVRHVAIPETLLAGLPPDDEREIRAAIQADPPLDDDGVYFTIASGDGSVPCPGCGHRSLAIAPMSLN
jgi:hypothetical protein